MSGIDGSSTSAPLRENTNPMYEQGSESPVALLESRLGYRPRRDGSPVVFTLNGSECVADAGETILQAAERHGIAVPHLCYTEGMRPDGNCRACVVEVNGERVLAPSCCRYPTEGMIVQTNSERATKSQRLVLELLMTDASASATYDANSELAFWAEELNVGLPRFPQREQPAHDFSHPGIEVRLDACIQCTRCVRACREVQVNDVIGYAGRGADALIVFDMGDPMGESTCVACGECVQACPTGAILPKVPEWTRRGQARLNDVAPAPGAAEYRPELADAADAVDTSHAGNVRRDLPLAVVDSLCPYCGVGCQTTFHVADNHVVKVEGRNGPSNLGRLCVKGRFGFDYVHHPQRLMTPLIRREGVAKDANNLANPANPMEAFREATWEEALEYAARGLRDIRDTHGPNALAGFGSAKGSNEEAYLFQKLVRAGFGTNNVDHCTRLCHASSVAALMENVASGAVSNPVSDVQFADCFIVIGANPTVNHPVAATFMKNAIERGAKLILMDPRRTEMSRLATHMLQFKPDTDVALLNAFMHVIIDEGLVNEAFIRDRTVGYEHLERTLRAYSPEAMQYIVGVPASEIRAAARLYATSKNSMIFWGMGISQHVHGTDNARCLISLALMTGQIGRRGTGLHPLRGQNNVQGASDVGLIPMFYPDYQSVTDPYVQALFEDLWGAKLDPNRGLTVVEIMHAAKRGEIRGMYVMGENPAMSDPDVQHAREAMAALDHLVVQDLFLTETAALADVVLPASAFPEKTGTFTNTDRRVQLGRAALELPGDTRQDLWIIQELARRIGLDWSYSGPADVWNEIRRATPSCAGITWERLERESGVTYPCVKEGDPGEEVIFVESFPTKDGRARFAPADFTHADEVPDSEYPFVLITGRILEHWHTGAMTRRASVLDAIEPVPTVSVHPADMASLGINAGDNLELVTRRGSVTALVRRDPGMPRGSVFMPFCYVEAAANILTNPVLDPFGKIPEFKYCAVQLRRSEAPLELAAYGVAGGHGGPVPL